MRRISLWLLAIAVWEGVSKLIPWVPSALGILKRVEENLMDPSFLAALAGSLRRMAIGYLGVCVLGVGSGLILGRYRLLDDLLGTLAVALHAVPGAAWVPLAVMIFGLNESAVIFTILLGASGVVMVNTSSGIKDVPPIILRAARTMGAKGPKIFWHVVVPAATPRIVDGLRLAWAFGWRALMAGELIIVSISGMGRFLNEAARKGQALELLSLMAIIAAIGMVVDGLIFRRLESMVRTRWGTA